MPEQPTPKVVLPPGIDATKANAIIQSYLKKSKTQGAKNAAKRAAATRLQKAHKPEYDGYLKEEKKVRNITD